MVLRVLDVFHSHGCKNRCSSLQFLGTAEMFMSFLSLIWLCLLLQWEGARLDWVVGAALTVSASYCAVLLSLFIIAF